MAAVAQLESNPQFASCRTGLTMTLPSNNLELAAAKGRYFMHKGMHLVESSIEIGRAMNEAIIFTFGLSGAGKSTTLNHLFGIKLAKVSDEEACTSDVSYFLSTMPSPDYELENLKIGFVDLPGWADGRGISIQAQNMAIIEQFIAEHPHLGNRARPCFPNVVLIVVNANDNRPKGPASQAVLMLKAIKHLHIIDRKRHNAVIVMTHVQSIPPNSIKQRKELYQGHCRAIFGFDPPFVYVENNCGEEGYYLPRDKDWTILNDGLNTKQPYNVFKALMDQMKSNYDEIGAEAVRIFFSSRNAFKPIITGCVDRSRVSKKSEQKWLQRVVHNPSELGRESVISQMIEHDSAKLTKCQKQMLEPLMCELYNCGICAKADLENLDMARVQSKVLPYVLQDFEMNLLIRLFKVKPLDFPCLYQHIPSTCKIINHEHFEEITEKFFTELPNSTHTSQGLLLPEFLKAQKYFYSERRIISFTNQTSNAPPSEEFEVDSLEKDFKITFHIKEILYRIYIELESIITKIKITEDFMHLINTFPIIEDESNLNLEQFQTFFEKYGHLVLTGSTCGGSIEGTMHFRMPEKEFNFSVYKYIIQECIQTLITTEDGNIESLRKFIPPNYSNLIDSLQRTKIKFNGGEAPLFCDSVENLTSQKYGIWVKSLNSNLIIVDKFDAENIQSMSQMVYKINSEKGRALNDAMIRLNESAREPELLTPLNSLFEQSLEERDRGRSFLSTMSMSEITQIQQLALMRPNIGASLSVIKAHVQPNQQPDAPPTNPPIQPIPDPPVVEDSPKTREDASSRAGFFSRAFLGFAGSSVVNIASDDNKRIENISLRELSTQIEPAHKPTDALCYFLERDRSKGSKITFNPRSDTSKLHDFVVVTIKEGEIKMGYYQRIFRASKQNGQFDNSFVKAINLNQGDHIYILNTRSRKLQTTEIINISSNIEIGCYYPKSNDYSLIVDLAVVIPANECFPGNASVTLKGGEKVRMDEVKIGDYVLSIHPSTGKPVYSKVYLWAHRDPHVTATFLHITHPHGHLHISANHLILSGEKRRPVPAGHLAVGDTIHSLLSPSATATATPISVPVLHIHTCTQVGYYAPFTNNGLIVVDGIASSVYSQPSTRSHAHVCASVTGGLVEQFGLHRVGECVMTPVRVGCKLGVGSLILTKQMDTTTHIHKYCQWLMKFINM